MGRSQRTTSSLNASVPPRAAISTSSSSVLCMRVRAVDCLSKLRRTKRAESRPLPPSCQNHRRPTVATMIQLSSIHKAFGARVLFDDVTWQVQPGERVGLCGPNGAGKTTPAPDHGRGGRSPTPARWPVRPISPSGSAAGRYRSRRADAARRGARRVRRAAGAPDRDARDRDPDGRRRPPGRCWHATASCRRRFSTRAATTSTLA